MGILVLIEKNHETVLQNADHLSQTLTALRYEGKPSLGKNIKKAEQVLSFLNNDLTQHLKLEEKILFDYLLRHVPKLETVIPILKSEHEDFRKNLKIFQNLLSKVARTASASERSKYIEEMNASGTYLIYLLRHTVEAEKESVYKAIRNDLSLQECEELEFKIGQLLQEDRK